MKGLAKDLWNMISRLFNKKIPFRSHYNNGQIRFEWSYHKREYNGSQKYWYANGNIMIDYFQKNGLSQGVYQSCDAHGKRLFITTLKSGMDNGSAIVFKYK